MLLDCACYAGSMHTAWRPGRGLEIVAGTPPGGGLDRTARALARTIETTERDV